MSFMTGGLGKSPRSLLTLGFVGTPAASTVITVTTYQGGGAVSSYERETQRHILLLRTIDGILVSSIKEQAKITGFPQLTVETKRKLYGILEKHIESLLSLEDDADESTEKEQELKKTLAKQIETDISEASISEKQIEIRIESQTRHTVQAYIKINGVPISKTVVFRRIKGKKSLKLVLSEILDI